ncbi:MAG: hypothetical protein H6925_03270 [Holosporaceae bacterium]|nr:MAG: hypothetical protein H6925_03270 [Holosporaceae bacterium]
MREENWIEILKEAFEKIPVKYLELRDARFSIHKKKDVYRFSDVNFTPCNFHVWSTFKHKDSFLTHPTNLSFLI